MTLPPFCKDCGVYHPVDAGCAPVNRLVSLKPSPKSRESVWGWVALIILAGIAVLSLGWCQ